MNFLSNYRSKTKSTVAQMFLFPIMCYYQNFLNILKTSYISPYFYVIENYCLEHYCSYFRCKDLFWI